MKCQTRFARQWVIYFTGPLLWLFFIPTCPAAPLGETLEVRTISVSPYGITNKQTLSGIYYDIANVLIHEAGYQANNKISPYARIIQELKTGKTDLTIMFKYKELETDVIYISALPALKNVVIGIQGVSFKSISSLKGKTIAYLRGAKFSDVIDEDAEIFKQRTTNFYQGIHMLAAGRVDAIIGPFDPILSAAIKAGKNKDFFGEPLIVSERTPWLQVSKKSKTKVAVARLATIFEQILARGELERLRKLYLPSDMK